MKLSPKIHSVIFINKWKWQVIQDDYPYSNSLLLHLGGVKQPVIKHLDQGCNTMALAGFESKTFLLWSVFCPARPLWSVFCALSQNYQNSLKINASILKSLSEKLKIDIPMLVEQAVFELLTKAIFRMLILFIFFQKRFDHFEIAHKTCTILVWCAVPP